MSGQEPAAQFTDGDGDLGHDGWSRALRDGIMLGIRCDDCGRAFGTPKRACPSCGSRALSVEELPRSGTVHSETTIGVPPEGFEERGYTVAVVALEDARVMARVDADVAIGDDVVFDGVDDGDRPAPVFAPE